MSINRSFLQSVLADIRSATNVSDISLTKALVILEAVKEGLLIEKAAQPANIETKPVKKPSAPQAPRALLPDSVVRYLYQTLTPPKSKTAYRERPCSDCNVMIGSNEACHKVEHSGYVWKFYHRGCGPDWMRETTEFQQYSRKFDNDEVYGQ